MYRVFGLRLGPNFGVWPMADKKFILTKKYLRLYGSGDTNYTAATNCGYPEIEIHNGTIEIQNH